jgi:APA family basic amino acid/polyamine antiporter
MSATADMKSKKYESSQVTVDNNGPIYSNTPIRRPGESTFKFSLRKLIACRSIEELIQETEGELKATLSWYELISIGVGIIIGTGIFVLTGTVAAQNTGPAITSAFIIAGAVSTLSALSFSELASMIPVAGSAYTYSYATMGEFVAWIIGWNLILEYLAGGATVAASWSGYMVTFLTQAFGLVANQNLIQGPIDWSDDTNSFIVTGAYINVPAVAITFIIGAILVIGTKESAIFTTAIVAVKLIVIFIFLGFSASHVDTSRYTPYLPPNEGTYGEFGASGLLKGASVVFFAYIGFDSVSTAAQEAKNPSRDMPIGIIGSLVICTILYIAVSLVMVGIIDYKELNTASPVATAISGFAPPWLTAIISFGAMLGLTSVLLVSILGQARIFYSMARDGLIPRLFYVIHPKFRTPWISTILISVVTAILAAVFPVDFLSDMTSVGTLVAFFFVNLAIPVLRYKQPNRPRRFKVPLGPYIIPILGAISCIVLIAVSSPVTIYRLLGWIAIGIVVYAIYGRTHSKINNPGRWADVTVPPSMEAH